MHLLGQNDVNLRHSARTLPGRIPLRDGTITVAGDEEAGTSASHALKELVDLAERGKVVEEADVATALGRRNGSGNGNGNGNGATLADTYSGAPGFLFDRKAVKARTPTQAEYLKALDEHDVVF